MAIIRDVLSEKGRFDFTSGASNVLQAYVEQIQVKEVMRSRVLAILESVSAELALCMGFPSELMFIRPVQIFPVAPDLIGMGIPVMRPIAILTTQWFQCNPTGTRCSMHFEALLNTPEDYLKENWQYVTIFAGDAAKAADVYAGVPEAYHNFKNFSKTFVGNQEPWMKSVTSSYYVDRVYRPLTFARLALWRMRLMVIYGVLERTELLSSFEEVLLESK